VDIIAHEGAARRHAAEDLLHALGPGAHIAVVPQHEVESATVGAEARPAHEPSGLEPAVGHEFP